MACTIAADARPLCEPANTHATVTKMMTNCFTLTLRPQLYHPFAPRVLLIRGAGAAVRSRRAVGRIVSGLPMTAVAPHRTKPELLAPAGDWDAMRAAVTNGADAVYFGLDNFNARHRATN